LQLEQSFDVAHSLQTVWRALEDLRATAMCIPGAEITNVEDNRKATGVFRVQLGPIKAAFAGEAEVTRDDATHSGTIKGAGRDGKNATRVNATVEYRLVPVNDATTRIELKVDYGITGPLAQFSRAGIVKEIAGSITRMFATNLGKMLDSSVASAAAAGSNTANVTAAAAPASHVPVTEPESLNFASLVLSMIWQRMTGIFKSNKQ
jgi:carbon monoxide dehydrogenase subunit G